MEIAETVSVLRDDPLLRGQHFRVDLAHPCERCRCGRRVAAERRAPGDGDQLDHGGVHGLPGTGSIRETRAAVAQTLSDEDHAPRSMRALLFGSGGKGEHSKCEDGKDSDSDHGDLPGDGRRRGRTVNVQRTMEERKRAALGFRAHTGWASVVAVAGPVGAPRVVGRRLMRLAAGADTESAQIYHQAEKLAPDAAEKLVKEATTRSAQMAKQSVASFLSDLRAGGYEVAGSGIVTASAKLPPTLQQILGSHAFVHSAEGELYRKALVDASRDAGIPVTPVLARELPARSAPRRGRPRRRSPAESPSWGRRRGSPGARTRRRRPWSLWSFSPAGALLRTGRADVCSARLDAQVVGAKPRFPP